MPLGLCTRSIVCCLFLIFMLFLYLRDFDFFSQDLPKMYISHDLDRLLDRFNELQENITQLLSSPKAVCT